MKYAIAIIAGCASAAGAAILTGLLLAIFNLYLTGHGITWQNEVYSWRFVSMSFLDLVFIAVPVITLVSVALLLLKLAHKKSGTPIEER